MTNAILIKIALSILAAVLVIAAAIEEGRMTRHYPTPQEKKQAEQSMKPMTNWAGAINKW